MNFLRGVIRFNIEAFPPKPKYSAEDVPDLTGRIVIVTGGNAGIGKETVKALLRRNAKVYMASRSKEKADAAIADLKKETGKDALFLELDLADLKAVKSAVEQFKSQETELHLLFNNGGVMWAPLDMLTVQGYDLQFGTNVLGHFYLTKLLLPLLTEGSKSSPDGKARIITIASLVRHLVTKVDYETLRDGPRRAKLGTHGLYNQSKFADVLLSRELAKRYGDQGIVSIGCAPGILKTDVLRHSDRFHAWFIKTAYMHDPPLGALTPLYAGTAPETQDANGAFFIPWARRATSPGKGLDDPRAAEELWEWLEEQVKDA